MRINYTKRESVENLVYNVSRGNILTDVVYQPTRYGKYKDKVNYITELIKNGVDVQPIYLSKNPTVVKGKTNLHDGLKRLTALIEFRDGKFSILDEKNTPKFFKELSEVEQVKFIEAEIITIVMEYNSIEEEYDGFMDLNVNNQTNKQKRI